MTTAVLLVGLVVVAICASAAAAAAVEHSTRATAWRQIALERRWKHEQNGRRG